jgi:hypothetical protein
MVGIESIISSSIKSIESSFWFSYIMCTIYHYRCGNQIFIFINPSLFHITGYGRIEWIRGSDTSRNLFIPFCLNQNGMYYSIELMG